MQLSDLTQPTANEAVSAQGCLSANMETQASGAVFTITVADAGLSVRCPEGISVLDAFERHRNSLVFGGESPVAVGCRRGGCGICKVRIVAGAYRISAMSRTHVSESEEAAGVALACRVYPDSNLALEAVPVCPRRLK